MKIVDQTATPNGRTTTLGEIPVGQVFRGNVYGRLSGAWTRGVFYKAHGPHRVIQDHNSDGVVCDVLVVRLDQGTGNNGHSNFWGNNTSVFDYEPLDVELVIKGVQR